MVVKVLPWGGENSSALGGCLHGKGIQSIPWGHRILILLWFNHQIIIFINSLFNYRSEKIIGKMNEQSRNSMIMLREHQITYY